MADFPSCNENGTSKAVYTERHDDGTVYEVWGDEVGNLAVECNGKPVAWDDPLYTEVISRWWPEEGERLRKLFAERPREW